MTTLGYKIGTICEALGLNRSSYYYKLQDKKSFGDEEIVKSHTGKTSILGISQGDKLA